MNYIFSGMVILSLITAFFTGKIDETVSAALDGAKSSVEIILSFAGIMCMWSGFLRLLEEGGMASIIAKLIRPITKILFPRLEKNSVAMEKISANISANLLGVGNAATPAGIEAMCELDKLNKRPDTASDEMSIFTVINTASIQLVPTTIIALRASFGSQNSECIMLPIWISSVCAVVCAVSAMKFILFVRKRKKRRHKPTFR